MSDEKPNITHNPHITIAYIFDILFTNQYPKTVI